MSDGNMEVNQGLKLLAKSSFVVSITLIISKVLLYLYRIVIARKFGPEIYGLFTLSVVIVSWFRLFSGLGIKDGVIRFISLFRAKNEKEKIQYILKKSLIILIFTSILAGILLFVLSDFIAIRFFSNSKLIPFLKIFSVTLPFTVLGAIFLSIIRGFEKISWFAFISEVLGNFIQLIILILLVFLGSNSVPISYLIGTFSIFIVAYFVSRLSVPNIFVPNKNSEKNKKTFKEMFSYSWPFLFYSVINFIFYWTDSFMIGIIENAESVGFYNAAVPIAMLIYLPFSLFAQLFFPLVTKEFSKGNMETVKQLSQQVGKWIFMIVMPIFVIFMIFPGVFINLLFGAEYLVAENSLRFLSIGALFITLSAVSQELLSMKGKSKLILFDIICATIINIILNAVFIPPYGINGAAFATMLSSIVLSALLFIQSYKIISIIPLRRKMLGITLIVIVSTILLLVIRQLVEINLLTLILCSIFFLAIYILLILLTNCLDKNDWYILKTFLGRLGIKKN
ncbi:MAG: flippase [Nanoarchaeota archaeon]|nr:flippase [Nanoarchaeota archaeon]